jgi:hypothetical protein
MEKMIDRELARRAVPRRPTDAAVICRPYVSGATGQCVDGIMRNFSRQGSYVELCGTYECGTILIVRILACPWTTSALDDCDQPRTICLAEVKWCHQLDAGERHRCGMGLRYLD